MTIISTAPGFRWAAGLSKPDHRHERFEGLRDRLRLPGVWVDLCKARSDSPRQLLAFIDAAPETNGATTKGSRCRIPRRLSEQARCLPGRL